MNAPKSIDTLKREAIHLAECREQISAEIEAIEKEIVTRMNDEFRVALKERGQEYGDVTLERDGVKLKMAISKTVSWDSDMLAQIASTAPDDLRGIFKAKITVSERDWNTVRATEIGSQLLEARTVKYGEPRVSFKD